MLSREGFDSFCFSDVDILPAAGSDLLPWYITPPPEGAVLHFPCVRSIQTIQWNFLSIMMTSEPDSLGNHL
jgi:hypothetical protein|eukprot:COSAG06_NODE_294_length_18179_cov_25.675830_16_plen_71_part_00